MREKRANTPGATRYPGPDISKCEDVKSAERTEHGQALIITLCFIVLATVLAVAFLTNVTTAGVGENAVASENRASQLAATAVQLVEGTIGFATESGTYPTVAWASQPGMVRTYGNGVPGGTVTASSSPLAYYKLYSSNNMVVTNQGDMNPNDIFSADVPQKWDLDPALFTDLNAPLTIATSGGNSARVFPIADPRADDSDIRVEGFGYNANGASGTIDGVVSSGTSNGVSTSDTTDVLPMPVRWMYVLKDGSVTVPDGPSLSAASNQATWSGTDTNLPTPTNPIVGRIAFWTDDECGKINVNTASEGTYWDTPISNSGAAGDMFTSGSVPLGDYVLANMQPVQHEYQRYPGHPATTCLSTVFGTLLNSSASGDLAANRAQMVKTITDMVPRISDYGNGLSGYAPPANSNSAQTTLGGTQIVTTGTAVVTDQDRLYASLDEFEFAPTQSPYATSGVVTRSTQNWDNNTSAATQAGNYVDTCRFFLTANSKASELNMFGLPRVAIWPVWADNKASLRTVYDSEIANCSTIYASGSNVHEMFFSRSDPTGLNTNDYSGISRNIQVYEYLQALMQSQVPGYGKSFSTKYGGTNSNQVLTEIFDYIRSTNLADNSPGATPYTSGTLGGTNLQPNASGLGQVVPIQINGTLGLGRIATIAEMDLVLTKVDDRNTLSVAESGTNLASQVNVNGYTGITSFNPKKQTLVEWALIPRLDSVMSGYVPLCNNLRIRFSKLNIIIGGNSSPSSVTYPDVYNTGRICYNDRDSVMGGSIGFCCMTDPSATPSDSMYPTGLAVVTGTNIPNSSNAPDGTIAISGTVTASLYAPSSNTTTAFQTVNFTFPNMTVPIPNLYVTGNTTWEGTFRSPPSAYVGGSAATFSYPATAPKSSAAQQAHWRMNYGSEPGDLISAAAGVKVGLIGNVQLGSGTDVVRSLSPTGVLTTGSIGGDIRLLDTAAAIPSSVFQPTLTSAGAQASSTTYCVDWSRFGVGTTGVPGYAGGELIPQVPGSQYKYGPEIPPQAPKSLPTTGTFPGVGDWDNGVGTMPDGPWANKPDEGMTNLTEAAPGNVAYIGDSQDMESGKVSQQYVTNFSPNRQISSPVMFGSLPVSGQSWRTLLFRPAILPGYESTSVQSYTHPGNATPGSQVPDHMLLDLFWMPVVEPYGISERFATSGKINLNCQIAPFTYIKRETGLDAILKPVMITAMNPNTLVGSNKFVFTYKSGLWFQGNPGGASNPLITTRYPIDPGQTIGQMTLGVGLTDTNAYPEFARSTYSPQAPNFFVSASQVCDLPLIPLGPNGAGYYSNGNETSTGQSLSNFWSQNSLTGDNSLERPYSMIYPRVTTKSNIFTVHVIAQSLKMTPNDRNQNPEIWTENVDQVTGEFHGAFTVEKYYDPDTTDLTDMVVGQAVPWSYAKDGQIPTNGNTVAIRGAKWRLLEVKRFGQ